MDLSNIKNGVGFVTEQEILDRLRFFTPPDAENYYIDLGRYSEVGACWYGNKKKLFCIYSGNQDLYNLICEMIKCAAEKIGLGFKVNIQEWTDVEST